MPTHRRLRLEWCRARGNWTATEWNQVVISDESRFNLSSDDNRVGVWRPRGERLNPAFALQRHIAAPAGGMVWGAIACNTRSPLVLIRGPMTAQRYVHDILQLHVLQLMQRLPGAIFQQDNARPHTPRVSQDCLHTVTTFPWPARPPELSPIEHIWDYLGREVEHSTSLNELKTRLQQIWNEMFENVIQNLYASIPDPQWLWLRIWFETVGSLRIWFETVGSRVRVLESLKTHHIDRWMQDKSVEAQSPGVVRGARSGVKITRSITNSSRLAL
ncbi:transposable element Tcb2 transposase [Trichonephila clavipes]|nr:transposable element Tcb2 transposase [Trichonephila clavipes]